MTMMKMTAMMAMKMTWWCDKVMKMEMIMINVGDGYGDVDGDDEGDEHWFKPELDSIFQWNFQSTRTQLLLYSTFGVRFKSGFFRFFLNTYSYKRFLYIMEMIHAPLKIFPKIYFRNISPELIANHLGPDFKKKFSIIFFMTNK